MKWLSRKHAENLICKMKDFMKKKNFRLLSLVYDLVGRNVRQLIEIIDWTILYLYISKIILSACKFFWTHNFYFIQKYMYKVNQGTGRSDIQLEEEHGRFRMVPFKLCWWNYLSFLSKSWSFLLRVLYKSDMRTLCRW